MTLLCSRRVLVMLAGSSLTGCGADADAGEPAAEVPAGSVDDLAVGTLRRVPGASAYVGRDTLGIYAMSSVCTHQACDMTANGSLTPQGPQCACHGSLFDRGGEVLRGPATLPLPHLAVTIDEAGNITLLGSTRVGANVRVVVE